MKILTFDTALNKTYISLCEDNEIIENPVIENSDDKYHSAFLIKELSEILKRNKLKMQNIGAIGINIGPGSFTGIRACTTVGRVIAQQINSPLVAVSSPEILSHINNYEKTLVTLDARKNSAYYAIYQNGIEKVPPKIASIEELTEKAKDYSVIADASMSNKLKEYGIDSINYEIGNYPLNEYLAEITYERLKSSGNNDFNWAKVKPLYIQPPSIFGK